MDDKEKNRMAEMMAEKTMGHTVSLVEQYMKDHPEIKPEQIEILSTVSVDDGTFTHRTRVESAAGNDQLKSALAMLEALKAVITITSVLNNPHTINTFQILSVYTLEKGPEYFRKAMEEAPGSAIRDIAMALGAMGNVLGIVDLLSAAKGDES